MLGFDNFGSTSLVAFQTDPLINLVLAALIITGGLGFMVWFDLATQLSKKKTSASLPYQVGSLLDSWNFIYWNSFNPLDRVEQSGNDWKSQLPR